MIAWILIMLGSVLIGAGVKIEEPKGVCAGMISFGVCLIAMVILQEVIRG